MFLRYAFLTIPLVILAACAEPPPVSAEQQYIEEVAAALGGSAVIEAVETLTMEGEGRMLNLGQDLTPESATMEFELSDYRLDADLANGRSRTALTRTPRFDYFRGRDPMRLVSGIDGEVAYDIGPDGSARRAHNRVAADRRSAYFHHPLPLLRAVLLGELTLGNVRTDDGVNLADVSTSSGKVFTLAVDAESHFPAYIRSTDHHSYLRDAVRQTSFSDYVGVDGLMLPTVISQSLEEFRLFRLQVGTQSLNVALSEIGAPTEVSEAPPVVGVAPSNVTAELLAEGVWLLAGQSHHSVLFEFSDHLKLLEAPNETRTLAVIAKARELVPDKPLTHVINTHHHFDHSAGLRAAQSEGLTIVTQAANEAFYRRMAEQPSTLEQDALARAPRPIDIEIVEDQRRYEDESMTLELYHVAGSEHSSSILMAYVPEQRLLIEADLYNPGRTTPQLFAPNLVDNIERYGLRVDQVVPIHGGVVEYAVLEAAVEALRP